MARAPSGGPSPRDEAARRGQTRSARGWDDASAPWLDEGDEEDGPTHTLVGRRTMMWLLFALAVLSIGVIVGIMLVSKRDDGPIDVPAVGEDIPVLASPGPWKVAPTGRDIDGIPVEGQGQVLFGTGDGRDPEARIALEALPEDPMPRPGSEDPEADMASAPAPEAQPGAAALPKADAQPAAVVAPPAATAAPKPTPKPVQPKIIYPPEPEVTTGGGQVLQLGAFSSESRARAAFKSMAERFGYLDGLTPTILPVAKDGQTLYRLRTSVGTAARAQDICGRLRVAGEACTVVD
jgi:hypothetical protein